MSKIICFFFGHLWKYDLYFRNCQNTRERTCQLCKETQEWKLLADHEIIGHWVKKGSTNENNRKL